MKDEVLTQTKDGKSEIRVWSSDHACGLQLKTPKGLMILCAEDLQPPYVEFFSNPNGGGTPSALYALKDNHLVIQTGCADFKHPITIVDTADLMVKTKAE